MWKISNSSQTSKTITNSMDDISKTKVNFYESRANLSDSFLLQEVVKNEQVYDYYYYYDYYYTNRWQIIITTMTHSHNDRNHSILIRTLECQLKHVLSRNRSENESVMTLFILLCISDTF